jgi:hypothetical protein
MSLPTPAVIRSRARVRRNPSGTSGLSTDHHDRTCHTCDCAKRDRIIIDLADCPRGAPAFGEAYFPRTRILIPTHVNRVGRTVPGLFASATTSLHPRPGLALTLTLSRRMHARTHSAREFCHDLTLVVRNPSSLSVQYSTLS